MPGHQDQHHLHREREQAPETSVALPRVKDLERRGALHRKGENEDEEGEEDGEDEGVGSRRAKEALEAMALLPSLVSLEIIASELSDETLAHLKLPDTVIHLGLKQNNISGPGLAEMSKRAQNLKTLGLEFNDLTNEALPDLVGFTTVENLYLS